MLWNLWCCGTFSDVGHLVIGRSVPWDILRVVRFKSWAFGDGTFLEWDVSSAGPFVCAPYACLDVVLCFTLFQL